MSNLTDALIAAKLVGGSGGSGGGSGLPEITPATTVLAEQSVAFAEQSGVCMGHLGDVAFAKGESYTVTWDGTSYTCVAFKYRGDIYVGNRHIYAESATDTGEPFVIVFASGYPVDIFTASTAASHTVKITTGQQDPADGTALSVHNGAWAASGAVLPPITGNITTVFAEQTLAFSKRNGVYGADPLNLVLAVGETYTVTWDGTDYTCTAVDDGDGGVAVGNLSILGMSPDTEEPFIFGYFPGDATYISSSSTAASHTIKITQGSQTPADGSVMIVQNGAWVAASLADLVNAIVNP